jgi:hypothetical protein
MAGEMTKKRLCFAGAIFLFFACSSDPVSDSEESAGVEISITTLEDGILVGEDASIPVSLSFSDGLRNKKSLQDLSLKSVLKNAEGDVLEELFFEAGELGDGRLPPVKLPPLEPGCYDMEFVLSDSDEIQEEKSIFFFYDPGKYTLTKISSYPLSLLPGSSGIFLAGITSPMDSDPYIRWTLNEKVLQASRMSEGGDRLSWAAPPVEGVYAVKVELFPFSPPGGRVFTFPAPVELSSRIYVNTLKQRLMETDFSPEEEYYTLFHFMGNLNDDGTRREKNQYPQGNLEVIGNPKLDYVRDVFGYRLDGDSGFGCETILFPRGEADYPLPCRIRMRILPFGSVENKILFRSVSADGTFEFILGTNPAGIPYFRLTSGNNFCEGQAELALPADQIALLELVLTGKEEVLESLWLINRQTLNASEDEFVFERIPSSGSSRIAGSNGLIGLVDEFGIRLY